MDRSLTVAAESPQVRHTPSMYYGFFGLSRPPFKITPDTDMFFEGGNRGAILEALIYAISQGEGIIKVTGEVGPKI